MNDLLEEAKALYAAYRKEVEAGRSDAREVAKKEFDKAVAQAKADRRETQDRLIEKSDLRSNTRLANGMVDLLNSGLTKTEFLEAIRTNTWSRAQAILSFATGELAKKAERIPAVGYVVDRAAGRVTIYPKWKPGRTGQVTGPQSIAHMTAHGPFTFFVGESGQKLVSLANAEWLNSDRSDAALGERAAAERKFGNLNSAALHELGAQEFGFRVDSGA